MLTSLAAKLKAAGSSSIAFRWCGVAAGDARLTLPALVLVAFLSLLVSQSLGQRNGFSAKGHEGVDHVSVSTAVILEFRSKVGT